MSTIVTRAGKGSPLTNTELDSNFTSLNTDKLEINAALGTPASVTLTNATGLPTAGLVDNAVTNEKLRDSAGLSVIGRGANSTGDPADIVAGTNHQVLRRDGSSLGFGAVDLSSNQAVTGTLPVNQGGTGITSFGSGVATWLGTPSSANLAAAVTDETGTGALVFANSPTLVTPALGTPASGVVTNLTGTASININGTVGATTPAAGAFTTLNTSGAVVFNEAGANVDFRVEGDTVPNLLFVDASADNVGIGTSSPGAKLNVLDTTANAATALVRLIGQNNFNLDIQSVTNGVGTVGNRYNFAIGSAGGEFSFSNSGGERMRLNSTGLGIGTSSPDANLTVNGAASFAAGTALLPSIARSGDLNTGIWFPAADTIAFSEGGVERMRIDSSGNLLVGTTVAASTQGAVLQVNTATAIRRNIASSGGTALRMEKSRSATDGGYTIVQSGDSLGELQFYGSDGVDFALAAEISAEVDDTPGSNDMPGRLVFSTSAGGSATPTERMRIDSSGNVGIGTSSPSWKLEIDNDADSTLIQVIRGASNGYIGFGVDGSNAVITGGTAAASEPRNLTFETAGASGVEAERMRITSAGNVGIGVTTPVSLLEVQGGLTTTGAVVTLSSAETSTVANDVLGRVNFRAALDAAGGDAILTGASIVALAEGTFSSTSNATSLLFQTGSSEAATTKMTLTSGGYLRLASGSLGIQFGGDTAAANALDDYEQGTFTPTLTAGTSGSYTLSVAEGRYTKIGDIVNVQINITVTAVSSPLGLASVGGLPFSYATGNKFAGSIYVEAGFNASIGTAVQVADSGGGGTSFYIFGYSAGARVTDAAPYIESTGKFQISLTYKV